MSATLARGHRSAVHEGWYDSTWLDKFIEAKAIIGHVAPKRLPDFVAAFSVLRVPADFSQRHVTGFFSPDQVEWLRAVVRSIPRDKLELREIEDFGRFLVQDWPEFCELQAALTAQVSDLAGEVVEPSYNFLSLYTKRGRCEPHLDSPSAKWTLDICLAQSEPWPIHFSDVIDWPEHPAELHATTAEALRTSRGVRFTPATLMPGDAILFSGSNQWHYRDAMAPGRGKQFCDLLFLHYIPQGTSELIQPRNWARLFDIPELAEMEGIYQRM